MLVLIKFFIEKLPFVSIFKVSNAICPTVKYHNWSFFSDKVLVLI